MRRANKRIRELFHLQRPPDRGDRFDQQDRVSPSDHKGEERFNGFPFEGGDPAGVGGGGTSGDLGKTGDDFYLPFEKAVQFIMFIIQQQQGR